MKGKRRGRNRTGGKRRQGERKGGGIRTPLRIGLVTGMLF